MSDEHEALRYPLAWPATWPRTTYRRQAMFSKVVSRRVGEQTHKQSQNLTVGDGLARLERELRLLGARTPVISSNLRRNLDGSLTANQAKMLADPGIAVYFRLHDHPRVLACDKWNSAADNMAAIAGHIEASRAQQRYGVGTLDQAFAGYAALPPVGGTQGGDWRAELECDKVDPAKLTLEMVEWRYIELLKQRHPDAGGSHDAVVRLNLARDAARAYFKEHSTP
jgi:hypothetical protein